MITRAPIARHRAEAQRNHSLTSIAKAVSSNAGGVGRQAAVVAAASGLVLTGGVAANAAELPMDRVASPAAAVTSVVDAPLTVKSTVKIRLAPAHAPVESVTGAPAPAVPQIRAQANTVTPVAPSEAGTAPAAAQAPAAPAAVADPAPAAPKAAPKAQPAVQAAAEPRAAPARATSGSSSAIASAALAQLGVHQDCTALVTNALAAVGIHHHGWPASYMALGSRVSEAQAVPGDLIYYADGGMGMAHIAVYIGNGKAVHGGWLGGNTVINSAHVGSGPVFIHIG